jgi:ABC-2 type transport system ATP-binding protein
MAIVIENLYKTYDQHAVLKNLDLHIKKGEVFGLLGPNGAGKTTLISVLNYLESYEQGHISIHGKNHKNHKAYIQSISSYVPQSFAFYPDLTAFENLEFFAALYKVAKKDFASRIHEALEMSALLSYKNVAAKNFSGGLKRRLNIAIGLLNQPKILYLDEPTVGIDPQSRKYILDIIKNINKTQHTTIIYTSHYMDEIEYLCDEIAILDQHHIIKKDSKENLIQQNAQVTIQLEKEHLIIDTSEGYERLLDTLSSLKQNNTKVIHIDFGNKSLEQMFLKITKQDLRD